MDDQQVSWKYHL